MSTTAPRYWILDENGESYLNERRTRRPIGFPHRKDADETAEFYRAREGLALTVTDKKPTNPLSRRQQPEPAQEKRP